MLIPCSRFTPATILPALPTTSTTRAAAAQSGLTAFSVRMVPSSAVVRRPAVGKEPNFKRKLEEEYEAKERSLEQSSRPEPVVVAVKDVVARFLNSKRNENLAGSISIS